MPDHLPECQGGGHVSDSVVTFATAAGGALSTGIDPDGGPQLILQFGTLGISYLYSRLNV